MSVAQAARDLGVSREAIYGFKRGDGTSFAGNYRKGM